MQDIGDKKWNTIEIGNYIEYAVYWGMCHHAIELDGDKKPGTWFDDLGKLSEAI